MKEMILVHEYVTITSEQDLLRAFSLAQEKGKELLFLAGGTDLMVEFRNPAQGARLAKAPAQPAPSLIADLSGYEELKAMGYEGNALSIGALCTCAQLVELLPPWAAVLAQAARSMGSPQIRHRATIGGNIANRAAAADTPPALVLLDAQVELRSWQNGAIASRRVPLAEYLREGSRYAGALVARVIIPESAPRVRAFYKQGKRNALAISTVSLAAEALAAPAREGTLVEKLRFVVGAVTPSAFAYEAPAPQTLYDRDGCMHFALRLAKEAVEAINQEYGPRASRMHKQDVIAGMLYQFLTENVRKTP